MVIFWLLFMLMLMLVLMLVLMLMLVLVLVLVLGRCEDRSYHSSLLGARTDWIFQSARRSTEIQGLGNYPFGSASDNGPCNDAG
ncbi:MAG: hypothetical protein ACK5O8_10315 [Pirellula sp.]